MHKPLFTILCLTIAITSFEQPKASKHFNIQKLSPGVWAAINNDKFGHAICNAGIVDMGDKTIIFDPFMNIDAALDLKSIAKKLTGREASFVVNSHYHNDHVRGNQLFLPATIISSKYTKERMAVSEPAELAWERENAPKILSAYKTKYKTATSSEKEELELWIGYYEAMVTQGPLVQTTLPTLTFNDSLWINGKKQDVLLVELKNGHSPSDVIMIIPASGIAFMGDLFFEKRHPYLGDGNHESWLTNVNKIYNDTSLKTFVPGHGPVAGKTRLTEMSNYITEINSLVKQAINNNQPDSVIKKSPLPAAYTSWKLKQFYDFNLNYFLKYYRTQNSN